MKASFRRELGLTSVSDVKELTPDWFTDPDFLRNGQGLDLGVRQDKRPVGDVDLPPWAASAEDFIEKHRLALESEYVSNNLHSWVDLIFGFKQQGEEAIKAKNVFFYLTYADNVDISSIADPALRQATQDQIFHFGQTPSQLLTVPHPRRFTTKELQTLPQEVLDEPVRTEQNGDNVSAIKQTLVSGLSSVGRLFSQAKKLAAEKVARND